MSLIISKTVTRDNSEKELLVSEVKALIASYQRISEGISEGKLAFDKAKKNFKAVNEGLRILPKLLSQSHCHAIPIQPLQNLLQQLRTHVTRISPTGNFIVLTGSELVKAKKLNDDLKLSLYKLIFEIGKK